MDRRTFVKNSALAVAAGAGGLWTCMPDREIPIIDTHQHLWDLELFPLGWLKPPLDRSFLMEDYLEATEGRNVVKSIYMEVGVPAEYRTKEALWALALCEIPGNPTVGAVVRADPFQTGFEEFIRGFSENPYLKGIRCSLGKKGEGMQKHFISNLRLMGRLGLSVDINLSTEKIKGAIPVIERCLDTCFILNHCGNADPVAFFQEGKESPREAKHDRDQWYQNMEIIAGKPNVLCKISGMVDNVVNYPLRAADLEPIINHCLDVFGPDRVIFGGDWPVCLRNMSLGRWIDLLGEIVSPRPEAEKRKLYFGNAEALYGLG